MISLKHVGELKTPITGLPGYLTVGLQRSSDARYYVNLPVISRIRLYKAARELNVM